MFAKELDESVYSFPVLPPDIACLFKPFLRASVANRCAPGSALVATVLPSSLCGFASLREIFSFFWFRVVSNLGVRFF
jgi:hypothetical protein